MQENEEQNTGQEINDTEMSDETGTEESEQLQISEENETDQELLLVSEEADQELYKIVESIDSRLSSISLLLTIVILVAIVKGVFQ